MYVSFAKQDEYKLAYGILCRALPAVQHRDGLFPTFCQIPVGGATAPHEHFEPEIFFITKGSGVMTIEGENRSVSIGDLVRIPPNSMHTLRNDGSDVLDFLSVYSEDFEIPQLPNSAVITVAPPTPNGPLHLGHMSGPYLASDILARSLRNQGVTVRTHSGTDDHQNYVGEKAQQLKLNQDVFHKAQRQRIQDGLKALDINFNEFIEPKSDHQYQFQILNFTKRAIQRGVIVKETLPLPHCAHCDLTLVDALSSGTCPECHSLSHGGCESCGIVVGAHELIDVHCARCKHSAESKLVEVYTFNLSLYLPLIRIELNQLNLPLRLEQLISSIAQKKDLKVIVSHPHNNQHGIRLHDTNQNLYVWFEMAAHYEQFALSPQSWIHFFGFDNSFYYILFIPALLRALNPSSRLPDAVVTNEFLLLEGSKFSTSRNHAIWADEFTGNTEHLRLFLAINRPSIMQSNFAMTDFHSFSRDLSAQIQAVLQRASIVKHLTMPSQTGLLESHRFTKDMESALSLRTIDLRQASRRLLVFLDQILNSFKGNADDRIKILTFSQQLEAFMPKTALELQNSLTSTEQMVSL